MAKDNDLPKRENKEQRKADQAEAARKEQIDLNSFSVPDRFAERRQDGQGSYESNR